MKSQKILTKLRSKTRDQTVLAYDHTLNKRLKFGEQIQSYITRQKVETNKNALYFFNLYISQSKVVQKRSCAKTPLCKNSVMQKRSYAKTPLCKNRVFATQRNATQRNAKFKALTIRSSNNLSQQREKNKMIVRKPKVFLIRPLLDFKRESITMVCKDFKIPIYPDQSNSSVQYSRNRIRKQIIPSIKYFINPQLENSLFKTAELLNKEQYFLYSLLKNSYINMHL